MFDIFGLKKGSGNSEQILSPGQMQHNFMADNLASGGEGGGRGEFLFFFYSQI